MKNVLRALGLFCILAFAWLTTAGAQSVNCSVTCSGGATYPSYQPNAQACCDKFKALCGSDGAAYWVHPSGYTLHCPSIPVIDP